MGQAGIRTGLGHGQTVARELRTGRFHYGWARLNVVIDNPKLNQINRVLLTGYAYETIPNKPIIAGKTKGPDVTTVQPASLGHLAAGASANFLLWRVKRTAATTP